MEEKNISQFSPNGKYLALINEYGVLKIWDTETNKLTHEYIPNFHLKKPCTCLIWIRLIKGKKSMKDKQSELLYLALGTNSGKVSLYSYSTGKIEKEFHGDGHIGSVTGITYNNSNLLFTISEDCSIIAWSIYDERKVASWSLNKYLINEKPCSILYLPKSNNLLIGAKQILLFSLKNTNVIQKFIGHSSNIILMETFTYNSVDYVITSSNMERILCMWILGKNSKHMNAVCTLLMEDIAYCLSCKVDEDENLKIAAVTRSGRIHIFVISVKNIQVEKPIKPTVTIEITCEDSKIVQSLTAIVASLEFECQKNEILFGYGYNNFLIFEKITLNFSEKLQILIRSNPKELFTNKLKTEQENNLKTITPFVNVKKVNYKIGTSVEKKKLKPVQIPMEQRIRNLYLSNDEVPQAQNKFQLLMQALSSKDSNLLSTVLLIKNIHVIQLTLQNLPIQYVDPLINELTMLMHKKRSNVQIGSTWLKVLLKTHLSQLMSFGSDELLNKFGPCLGIIEHRSNCLKELVKLKGSLQVLTKQIKRTSGEDEFFCENVLNFEDKDISEYESEKDSSSFEWDKSSSDNDENLKNGEGMEVQ